MRTLLIASIALVLSSFAASSAVLRSIEGGVEINVDNGFTRVATTQELAPGRLVRTAANGSAELVYPNGCVFQISANQTVRVQDNVTCDDNGVIWIVGGAALIGGVAAVVIANDDDPASP